MNNTNLLSCRIGTLVPFMWEETVPQDIWKIRSEILAKFAPMTAPIMSNVDIYTWFFYVPYRLIWKNAENFFTGGTKGQSNPAYPTISIKRSDFTSTYKSALQNGSLFDFLGGNPFQNPPTSENQNDIVKIDALPFRAYQLIYYEYFRDQNVGAEYQIPTTDGDTPFGTDALLLMTLRNRKYSKDYFTSALPWAQRGGEVTVPLSGRMDVMLDDELTVQKYVTNDGSSTPQLNKDVQTDGSGNLNGLLDPNGTLYTDFDDPNSNVGLSIEALRYSNALQRWLENNAKYGSRYIEQLLARFGVVSSDARLQRPQLVGGGKQSVLVSEILQTSQSTETSPQGNRSGDANSYGQHSLFKRLFCEERGILMGIMCVAPQATYFQGIPKKLQRHSRFDHFYPEFQTLGEQPIKKVELFLTGNKDLDDATFGYTPRYSDYKHRQNEVHGDFKGNLSFWHMSRKFGNSPSLNDQFLSINDADFRDVFAVTDVDTMDVWVQIYNHVSARRPMMYNPNPSL